LKLLLPYDLQIWHAFFGCARSINDLNVLDRSSGFQELYENRAPKCEYMAMVASTISNTSYLMVFIQNGQPLSKLFAFLKGQRQNYLLNIKNLLGRMWREPLGFYKLGSLSSMGLLGTWRRLTWV